MIGGLSYFFYLGFFQLSIMTFTDIRSMRIDSRLNYFMYGVVASLIWFNTPPLLYVLLMIFIGVVVSLSTIRILGVGDVQAVGWIVLGVSMISPARLFMFFLFFSLVFSVYLLVKHWFVLGIPKELKYKIKSPGMPVLWGAFVLTMVVKC